MEGLNLESRARPLLPKAAKVEAPAKPKRAAKRSKKPEANEDEEGAQPKAKAKAKAAGRKAKK